MLDRQEIPALLRLVQSQRHTTRQSLHFAVVYVSQLFIATIILLSAYSWLNAKGVMWAIVSAILVLQPGIQQSIAASAVRIAANIVGGSIAFAIGYLAGTGTPQLLAALALVVLACELLRLDLGLRTACVAALIVLTANENNVTSSAAQRLAAVLIGCILAILIQITIELIRRLFNLSRRPPAASPPSAGENE